MAKVASQIQREIGDMFVSDTVSKQHHLHRHILHSIDSVRHTQSVEEAGRTDAHKMQGMWTVLTSKAYSLFVPVVAVSCYRCA